VGAMYEIKNIVVSGTFGRKIDLKDLGIKMKTPFKKNHARLSPLVLRIKYPVKAIL
jgi:TATA-box binding protein (TBP) (component of TFIID and TFIIIB)